MQPDNPAPGASTNPNPYDFILKENPKPKRSLLPGGNSKTTRIIVVLVIVVLLLFLGIILFSALSASNSAGNNDMIGAAQQQQEIARIADLASQKARQTETKNIAIISAETMRSDQLTLTAYLKKNGKKVSTKELAADKNAQTDTQLTQAEQDNHFDSTFTTVLAKEVASYQKSLKDAHDHVSSSNGKRLLEKMYTNAATLSEKLQKLNGDTPANQ